MSGMFGGVGLPNGSAGIGPGRKSDSLTVGGKGIAGIPGLFARRGSVGTGGSTHDGCF